MMNKILLGHKARGSYFEALGRYEDAVESFSKCRELPDVLRSLALVYSDMDDLEKAIATFEEAVKSGDLKSVPWLVALLQTHRPNDPQLPILSEQMEKGVQDGNLDYIFSLGNLHLISGEFDEAFTFWSEYINLESWLINRNIAGVMTTRYLQFGHLVPPPMGPLESEEEALQFFMRVNEKGYKEGNSLALVDIGVRFAENPGLDIFRDYSPTDFFNSYISSAQEGHEQSILMAIHFATVFEEEIPDDTALLKLVDEYGLTDMLVEMNYRQTIDGAIADINSKYGSINSQNKVDDAIQEIFNRAEAAQKEGDSLGEITAWVEGAKLGDASCFHNVGVALCSELGIVHNFFGAQGGEDKAWSPLAKGIEASEDRRGRGALFKMSRSLSANQLNSVAATYGGKADVELEPLKPGQESSLVKVRDLFEKCGFVYSQLDQNLIALPFGSRYGNFLILCELVEDDGKDLALIYTCLLTSKFDEKGTPISGLSGLNNLQEKVLEVLIRDQELVFPSMMMDLGDIFNLVPKDKAPESFINITKAKEYWFLVGATAGSSFYEALPTQHEFEKIEFGYGVDLALQSDHFETAIRAIAGSITGLLDGISAMQVESPELFDLFFDYSPSANFDYEANLVDYDELAKLGSKSAQMIMQYQEKDQNKRLENLLALSEAGIRVARRVMVDAIDLTPSNIDVIAQEMLKEAEIEENHPQVRDALNNIGWKYSEFGNGAKAAPVFEKAARLGSGNALANLSWALLMTGEHEDARKAFDECYYRIMTTRETENDYEQGANIRSNDALHRFALGAPHEELRSIWMDSHFQENHLESKFYPIVLDHIEGNSNQVQDGLAALNSREKKELIEVFKSLLDSHDWISGIAQTSLELLGEEPQKKKGLFRR
jgi:tetratricopeptide (TPR) repeat protein